VLPEADFVVLTVPHTPETEGMIDSRRLRSMRPSAVLVNVGRGATVRLDDLVGALDAGELAGAALDVFETEPLPATHPLWSRTNVIITPHVAGFGEDTEDERLELIVDNARRFLQGRPLRNVVDKQRWF
jgi:phosphoglycerate dehydrogenase-like enzyme